jgi:hypothetical protein
MWKVYVGCLGKVFENINQSEAEKVYDEYEALALKKKFWQPYIRLVFGSEIKREFWIPRSDIVALPIDDLLSEVRSCKK